MAIHLGSKLMSKFTMVVYQLYYVERVGGGMVVMTMTQYHIIGRANQPCQDGKMTLKIYPSIWAPNRWVNVQWWFINFTMLGGWVVVW